MANSKKFKDYRTFESHALKLLREFNELRTLGQRYELVENELIILSDDYGSYIGTLKRRNSMANAFFGGDSESMIKKIVEFEYGGSTASRNSLVAER